MCSRELETTSPKLSIHFSDKYDSLVWLKSKGLKVPPFVKLDDLHADVLSLATKLGSSLILRGSVPSADFRDPSAAERTSGLLPSVEFTLESWPLVRQSVVSHQCDWVVQSLIPYRVGAVAHFDCPSQTLLVSAGPSLPMLCSGADSGIDLEIDLSEGTYAASTKNLPSEVHALGKALAEQRQDIGLLSEISPHVELEICLSQNTIFYLQAHAISGSTR